MVLVIFFSFFLSRLAQSCTTDLMNFWSITCCESPWCEHIFSAGNWFLSNFKSNHQSRTISWILIRFWKRQIENFLKIRARSNRIELDQIWFSCLNRIFVIFTEFLRSFGQKVKTFWVSMPFDTFPNQIHYESILDFPWFSRLISKLLDLKSTECSLKILKNCEKFVKKSLRHCPSRHNVIHNTFTQSVRYLI